MPRLSNGIGLATTGKFNIPIQIPFAPQPSDLSVWLDASDSATVILEGGVVSQWNDKSPNGFNVSQIDANKRPSYFNGNEIGFPSWNYYNFRHLSGSGNYNVSDIFVVGIWSGSLQNVFSPALEGGARSSSEEPSLAFLGGGETPSSVLGGSTSWQNRRVNGQLVSYGSYDGFPVLQSRFLHNVYRNSGVIPRTGTSIGINSINLNTWRGGIHELIICNKTLTEDIRFKYEGYLAHKWNLTNLLPITHPYKSNQPMV